MQHKPDILVISEANLLNEIEEYERQIMGYKILLPLTTPEQKVARLVILIKDGIRVEVQKKYMDNQIAAIWLKIGARGKKPLLMAGVYREHRFLFQETDISATDRNKLARWKKCVDSWIRASLNQDVVVLGDTNIDYLRWDNPDTAKVKLVELMKEEV